MAYYTAEFSTFKLANLVKSVLLRREEKKFIQIGLFRAEIIANNDEEAWKKAMKMKTGIGYVGDVKLYKCEYTFVKSETIQNYLG